MMREQVQQAIELLRGRYPAPDHRPLMSRGGTEKKRSWLGSAEEEISVVVYRHEDGYLDTFDRYGFFYFTYTRNGEHEIQSSSTGQRATLGDNSLLVGKPSTGIICIKDDEKAETINLIINQDCVFRALLPAIVREQWLRNFFLEGESREDFVLVDLESDSTIPELLELMAVEYAFPHRDSQLMLKSLAIAFLLEFSRQYHRQQVKQAKELPLAQQICNYINQNIDTVTLKSLSKHFSYNPNYFSTLIRRETGLSFSKLLLKLRMENAAVLLRDTGLSVQEVSLMVGYRDSSNFYKAFRQYFHRTPKGKLEDL